MFNIKRYHLRWLLNKLPKTLYAWHPHKAFNSHKLLDISPATGLNSQTSIITTRTHLCHVARYPPPIITPPKLLSNCTNPPPAPLCNSNPTTPLVNYSQSSLEASGIPRIFQRKRKQRGRQPGRILKRERRHVESWRCQLPKYDLIAVWLLRGIICRLPSRSGGSFAWIIICLGLGTCGFVQGTGMFQWLTVGPEFFENSLMGSEIVRDFRFWDFGQFCDGNRIRFCS